MGRTAKYSTRGGERGTTNGNDDLCWALLLAQARGADRTEQEMLAAMRNTIHIAQNDWLEAIKQLPAGNVKWKRKTLLSLATDATATAIVGTHATRGKLRIVKSVVDAWVASTVDSAGVACRECGTGVRVGLVCSACTGNWHYGCLWRSVAGRAHAAGIPPSAVFAANGTYTFTCTLCRQGASAKASARGSLLQRFRAYIENMTDADALTLVKRALDAPGVTRRRLPGRGTRDGGTSAGRLLAAAAVAELARLATAGSRSAELLLLYAPRLFMRKGSSIDTQITALIDKASFTHRDDPTRHDCMRSWAASLEAALEDGNLKKLTAVVERGPRVADVAYERDDVNDYFPDVTQLADEEAQWTALRAGIASQRRGFTSSDLRKWAATHRTSSGGSTGWTGALISQMFAADASVGAQLSALWSRAPTDWNMAETADDALRLTDGWPIPKGDGQIRFLAAPQFVRRVSSAVLMSRARPLAERYCREHGQYGLSGDQYMLTYSLLPLLTLTCGGTVVVADRSKSFQTFRRDAVFRAVQDVITHRLPSEDDAAAALVDACIEMYADNDTLTRTSVRFRELGEEFFVEGLAQGCSLSPTLEAITLAWLQSQSTARVNGTVRRAAHDDLVLIAQAGVPPLTLKLPDCNIVGGAYNASKSAAFGSGAAQLVAAAQASSCNANVGTVWGRPLGSLPEWFDTVWMPRFRKRCAHIRTLAVADAAVAIWSAHAMRGPGSMCNHVLRGIPPAMLDGNDFGGDAVRATLRTADTEWIQLIIELTGTKVATVQTSDIRRAREIVFGRTLGHISAEAIAAAAAAAGLATAFRTLAAVAIDCKLDMTPWAKPLGIPLLAAPGPDGITQATLATIECALTDAATSTKTAYDAALAPDANADGGYGNDVCLWVEALTAPGPLHAAIKSAGGPLGVPALRSAAVQFALARIVGVPVWQALGGVVPIDRVASATACGLCQAASLTNAVAHVQGTSALVGNTASHASTLSPSHRTTGGTFASNRPRARFDPTGEHIGACARVGRAANNKTRHDMFVRGVVGLATECGICAEYHDRPVFQTDAPVAQPDRRRPADWMEVGGEITSIAKDTHYAGRCFDLTIRTGDAHALDAAVHHKHSSYQRALQRNTHYGFTVFGVSTNGRVCREAADTLTRWEVNLVRHRRRNADLIGHPRREVRAAVGLLFASVMTAQAAAYVSDTNAAPTTARGDAHSNLLRVRTRTAQPAFGRYIAGFTNSPLAHQQPPQKMTRTATAHAAPRHVVPSPQTQQHPFTNTGVHRAPVQHVPHRDTRSSSNPLLASTQMLVDDQDIDSVIAELDFHQSDDSPHVTARHAAGAPAAHWIHSSKQHPELVNSNRLRGIATDGNTTSEAEATTAAISINTSHTGSVSGAMRGVVSATCEPANVPAGAQSLRK